MDLFQPDDLSQETPDLIPFLDKNKCDDVASVLCAYLGPMTKIEEILTIGSSHTISDKFIVNLDCGKFFLKSRPKSDNADQFFREGRISEFLARRGVNVPRCMMTQVKEYGCSLKGRHWLLFEFVQGRHFTGDGCEFDSVAEVFAQLTKEIEGCTEISSNMSDEITIDDLQTLLDLAIISKELDSWVPRLLSNCYESIMENLSRAETERNLVEEEWAIMHTEFHPMNLLMDDEKVAAVLDFEDVNRCPVLAALGYNAYKLIRQMMIDPAIRQQELINPTLVDRWLLGWRRRYSHFWGSVELGCGARYRVLGLIRFILHRSLRQGQVEHIYDLEKLVHSLYEIEEIFGFSRKEKLMKHLG